jgi:hypothetical protein
MRVCAMKSNFMNSIHIADRRGGPMQPLRLPAMASQVDRDYWPGVHFVPVG